MGRFVLAILASSLPAIAQNGLGLYYQGTLQEIYVNDISFCASSEASRQEKTSTIQPGPVTASRSCNGSSVELKIDPGAPQTTPIVQVIRDPTLNNSYTLQLQGPLRTAARAEYKLTMWTGRNRTAEASSG